jgi:hypothetical protein
LNFLIFTALKAEARPFIEVFELVKNQGNHLYLKDNISLFITGVGKVKTAKRIQTLLNHYTDFTNTVVFNIGIAGGNPKNTFIGELYRVNAIHDEESKLTYYPDILIRHPLKELYLTTVSIGIFENGDHYQGLVDMEGSIIFKIMSKVVPPHRLVFLKVVSDHMVITDWKSLDITGLINNQIEQIQNIVSDFNNEEFSDRIILTNEEIVELIHGVNKLRLTATQYVQLVNFSEKFKKRTGYDLAKLKLFFDKDSNSKLERNKIFEQIKQFLST